MTEQLAEPVRRPSGWIAKHAAIALASARATTKQRGDLAARVIFYYAILFVFSQLWKTVLALDTGLAYTQEQMVWYLAATEWVILSIPDLHLRMEEDARSGDIGFRLSRPVSYFSTKLAEGAGAHVVRLFVLGVAGLGGTAFLVGAPLDADAFAAVVITGCLGSVLGLAFMGLVGLTAVWLDDVSPTYLVWQKLTFILGGLILPMEIYPGWLETLASWTPFWAMLYGTGRWTLELDSTVVGLTVAKQVGWIVIVLLGAVWLSARATRRLERTGG